jgi:D-glycero-D-manno-heptose 1,7-bisphosphate phosphatase
MRNTLRGGVLLERDGVILRHTAKGWANTWNELEFLPRALEGLRLLTEYDIPVVVVSHQPCVAAGQVTPHELHALTQRMLLEVALAGGKIEKVYYCPHSLKNKCLCQKPFPGLILRAMSEMSLRPSDTWAIGEGALDMEAASRAGCRGILLRRDAFLTSDIRVEDPTFVASSLHEAAETIVRRSAPRSENTVNYETTVAFPQQSATHSNLSVKERQPA